MEIRIASCYNNEPLHHSSGLGVLLMYSNYANATAVIYNSCFDENCKFIIGMKTCVNNIFLKNKDKTLYQVMNALGLTIVYFNSSSINISVYGTTFIHNIGTVSTVSIQQIDSPTAQAVFNRVNFSNNFMALQNCHGSGISHFLMSKRSPVDPIHRLVVMNLIDTIFHGKYLTMGPKLGASVYIGIYNTSKGLFKMQSVKFVQQSAPAKSTGACVYAASYTPNSYVTIVLESIVASDNSQYYMQSPFVREAMFYLYNINHVLVTGSSSRPGNFSNNFGSVITLIDSVATLEGVLLFSNNSGYNGPAMKLFSTSYLLLHDGLRANFTGNRAQAHGGAIYADLDHQCTFQVKNSSSMNINMYFIDNTASQAGSSIYSTNIYNCSMKNEYLNYNHLNPIYNRIFHFIPGANNRLLNISTRPNSVERCFENGSLIGYPGRTVSFSLAAIDVIDHKVFGSVSIDIVYRDSKKGYTSLNNWYISKIDREQFIDELNCTNVSITLFQKSENRLNPNTANLLFNYDLKSSIMIELHNCPPGFDLDPEYDKCICSITVTEFAQHVMYKPECDIQSGTISRALIGGATWPWAGVIEINKKSVFAISVSCHRFCNLYKGYNYFIINDRTNVTYITNSKDNLSDRYPLCPTNRGGPLCSRCIKGTSVVLGPDDCKHCSDQWLWTIALYIALGPLLIYLMSTLKLTLTSGTLNGIIFCAQVSAEFKTGSGKIYKHGTSERFLYVYINFGAWCVSVLNLGLGVHVPICLYAEMDEFVKRCVQLLFPLYLLTIVVFLILASHYSVSLSNCISPWSVQVLVTVIHLSFAGICETVIDVFTPTYIYVEGRNKPLRVWYSDGTVEYGKGKHLCLMIGISVVAAILILPYITLLIGGRFLMRCRKFNKYLRPLHEAIHAPYKDKQQHWFGARLLLVILTYVLHACLEFYSAGIEYVILLLLYICFTIAQAYYRPFKRKIINTLDLLIMIWFTLSSLVVGLCKIRGSLITADVLVTTSTIVVFSIFVAIVTHNILDVTGWLDKIKAALRTQVHKIYARYHRNQEETERDQLQDSATGSEYREPLLSCSTGHTRSDSYGAFS